jgi:siroheme synthase
MSSENLEQIVDNLISAGIEKDKGLAIIEQASTPFQHVVNCSIEDFEKRRAYESIISPAIIVIGRVAVLNSHFSWMPDNCERKNYFEQLEDKKENYARA